MYKTIFLDMDGVLSDLDSHVRGLIGKSLHEFDTSQEGWGAVQPYVDTFFKYMQPMWDADILVGGVSALATEYRYKVAILTAVPKVGRIPTARIQKLDWIYKHFPELSCNFNIGPHAQHKQFHCIPGDILIDDNIMNIDQWNAVGGFGIYHTSADDSLAKLRKYLEK